jgi:hypothetical protein
MWFYPWANAVKFAAPRLRPRTHCASRRSARAKLFLEALEDRTVPSGNPIPIPGAIPDFHRDGGPDIHFQLPGPADNTSTGRIGGEPSAITNFNGFIGVAHVEGTGTDNLGNTLYWNTDLRFMNGVFVGDDGKTRSGTFAFI